MTTNYRWPDPYTWLETSTIKWDIDRVRSALLAIAICCDSDTLQVIFRHEMEDSGYFNPINS